MVERIYRHLSDVELLQELRTVRGEIAGALPGPVKQRLRAKEQDIKRENTLRYMGRLKEKTNG